MKRYEPEEGERIVIVEEKRSSDIGALLLGLAVGAGLGLLLAPRPGVETRQALRRRLRAAQHAAGETAGDVAERVTGSFAEAREEIERRIEPPGLPCRVARTSWPMLSRRDGPQLAAPTASSARSS